MQGLLIGHGTRARPGPSSAGLSVQGFLLGREQLVPAGRGGLGLGARPQARAGRSKLLDRRLAAAGGLGLSIAAPPRLARVLALLLALAAACTPRRPQPFSLA